MKRVFTRRAAAFAAAFLFSACSSRLQVKAIEYGSSLYPVDFLGTEETGPYARILWLFYVIETPGSVILVDTGMTDPAHAAGFAIRDFRPAASALRAAKIDPGSVTHVVITHSHIDHIGSVSLFPAARLYLQKREFEYFEKTERYEQFRAVMEQSRASGRLMLVDGNLDLAPGLRILDAGGHTPGSQAVQIESGGSLLITGDNCYFASACRKGIVLPAAAAHEPEKNRAFVEFARKFPGKIVTLHDPAIVEEESIGPGIYRVTY
jgi:N-acyl homoserine lactone hydrolase